MLRSDHWATSPPSTLRPGRHTIRPILGSRPLHAAAEIIFSEACCPNTTASRALFRFLNV